MTQRSIGESASDETSLNPTLVSALQLAFPEIRESLKIEHAGEHRSSTQIFGIDGRPDEFGEQYASNCPFCGDKRGRMTVNHTYDPIIHRGRWHCYNEGCGRNAQHRNTLASRLQAVWRDAKQATRTSSRATGHPPAPSPRHVTSVPLSEITLPTTTIPIHQLSPYHPALNYLRRRNFDFESLWNDFGIGYCDGSRWPAPAIGGRIVVPICTPPASPGGNPTLIGWQARLIPGFTQDQHPNDKYLTMAGFRKAQHLYSAINGPVGDELFVVEGVTDAWRLGRSAVAILGKTASPRQLSLLVELGQFRTRIFVALDRDAESEKQQLVRDLQSQFEVLGVGTQVYSLPIPEPHKDAGDCNLAELMGNRTAIVALESNSNIDATPPQPPTALAAEELPQPRVVTPNELAARLIENATGTLPAPSTDYSDELQRLGMTELHQRLEVPLQSVLRAIERPGLLISVDRLRAIVCNNASLASEGARLREATCRHSSRIYTQLDSLGSCTGMITSRNYALQNMRRELRSCAVAGENKKLIYADFGQFQWRIAAAQSQDPLLLEVLSNPGFDLYLAVSIAVFGIHHGPQFRQRTKDAMMVFLFSHNRFNLLNNEERAVSQFLTRNHPTLVGWLQEVELEANLHGTVRTPFGRMIRLPNDDDGNGVSKKAVNYLIQATAADVFKQACLSVHRAIVPSGRVLLVLHDAVLVDCYAVETNGVAATVARAMERPIREVPVRWSVKTTISDHWG